MLNEVRLIGRLTRDPELRALPSGSSLAIFGMALNRKYKDNKGEMKEEVLFLEITCWSKMAEIVAKFCKKGRMIFVAGRLKMDTWDDKKTGEKRNKLSVVAENVLFLERSGDEQHSDNAGSTEMVEESDGHRNWAQEEKSYNPPRTSTRQPPPKYSDIQDPNNGWEAPDIGEPPF